MADSLKVPNKAHVKRVDVVVVDRSPDRKVTFPEDMTYEQLAEFALRKQQEEEADVQVIHQIKVLPWEGAYAMVRAMEELFGYSTAVPTPGFFGAQPPAMITIEIDVNKSTQVPWGRFTLPGVAGWVQTGTTVEEGHVYFQLAGVVKKKHEHMIVALANRISEIATNDSIYRGKVWSIQFTDDEGEENPMPVPRFVDVSNINDAQLVLSSETTDKVDNELFKRIQNWRHYKAVGERLRRGFLFGGLPGVGKTLICAIAAKKARLTNHWTYIICKKSADLPKALKTAELFGPYAIVQCEDIDRSSGSVRTEEIDRLLNQLDGVDTKSNEFILLLTSNDPESITQAMLRPGRVDEIVLIPPPDAEAAERLMRLASRGALSDREDLKDVGRELAGAIPSVIEDVVKSARAYAINRLVEEGKTPNERNIAVTAKDLMKAAIGKRLQRKLLAPPSAGPSQVEQLGKAIGSAIASLVIDEAKELRSREEATARLLGDQPESMAARAR